MRLFTTYILTTFVCATLVARPLSFERRSPDLFRARLNGQAVVVHPDSLSIGDATLRFANPSSASHLEGIGTSSPATYLSAGSRHTFPQFSRLALRQLYPGVDVIFYGSGDHLEYDLIVSPRANLDRLKLLFDGARSVQVDAQGNLKVETRSGYLLQMLPRVFQSDGRPIPAAYVQLPNLQVGFRIGRHNPRLALTIDPELVFTKYFGGSAQDSANAITTDAQGNIYIAGTSNSVDFPTTNGIGPTPRAPLATISSGGAAMTPLPVSTETSVLAIGGTPDGSVLYVFTPDASYVSSDRGATWLQREPLPLPTSTLGFPTATINSVTVDPVDPSRVFVATNVGLYSTSQGGEFWGLFDFGLPTGGSGLVNALSLLISPIDHTIMYVVTGSDAGLLKTTNAGADWKPLIPTYPGQVQTPAYQSYVATLGPNGSDLYVVDPYGTLLRSTDGGATWQEFGQGLLGATAIQIDPANPMNIYVSGYGGIQKSSDGGVTFSSLLPPSPAFGTVNRLVLDPASGNLYFAGNFVNVYAIPSTGGPAEPLPLSTPNLHYLATLGGQVYVGFDTPSVPYVIKWDPTGSNILYSTFIGGTTQDSVSSLAIDAQGNCTVAGFTDSPDFPVTSKLSNASPGRASGFVTRLSADGTRLLYSVLLGGASNGSTSIQALALDPSGAAYVTGGTDAPDFPLSSNAIQSARPQPMCTRPQQAFLLVLDLGQNAFVSKISPDGSQLVYSSLITGSCGSVGQGIAVNAAGEAFVAGSTTSTDLPTTTGTYQPAYPGSADLTAPPNAIEAGFAARISAAGDRMIAGTYLGGSYVTVTSAITLDALGNAYLTGQTAKLLPGATPGAYQTTVVDTCAIPGGPSPHPPYGGTNDAFVLKLDPTLSTAGYLTYLGGGCNDSANAIALDASGNVWITGLTLSPDFPLKSPFQGAGISDHFISEIAAGGSQLLFSSSTDGVALAIDLAGIVHLAGTGTTPTIPKHVLAFGQASVAEWNKIDPAAAPALIIDNVLPITHYPPSTLSSTGLGVVPGELLQITGRNLGPATQTNGQLDATGRLPFTLAGTTVLFDNIPAPIVSLDDTTVTCFAPFEISRSTTVTVESNGQRSNAVRLGVAAVDVQILTVTNPDGTLNSADHPAKPGDEVVLYVSGLGVTNPLSADGLTNTAPLPAPTQQVRVFVLNSQVQPDFIGAAPGEIAGIMQINIRLPATSPPSNPLNVGLNAANAPVYVSP